MTKFTRLISKFTVATISSLICLIIFKTDLFANNNLKIVGIGDSITHTGASQTDGWLQVYANYLNQDLNTNTTITNLGTPSASSALILQKVQSDQSFKDNIGQADFVTLNTGINDFFYYRGQYQAGTCGGTNNQDCLVQMINDFSSNYTQTLNEINTLNPNVTVKVMDIYYSVATVDQLPYSPYSNSFPVLNNYLSQMNNFIHTESASRGISVANVHATYNGPDGSENPIDKGYILGDAIHPTSLGHLIIAQQFRDIGYFGLDNDSDGIADATDNCPGLSNPDQANFNSEITDLGTSVTFDDWTNPISDNIGDSCDLDIDHDGLNNAEEQLLGTDPNNPDSDGDRVRDNAEYYCGSDPLNPLTQPTGVDSDNDKVPNTCEQNEVFGSNPNLVDTDGDKVTDLIEIFYKGTDPTNPDTDNDGCSDATELASVNEGRNVNSIDLSQVAQKFGQLNSNSNFNFRYSFDYSGDGNISAIDLGQVAQKFTTTPCSDIQ